MLAIASVAMLVGCGGGDASPPPAYASKNISGIAIAEGLPVSNAVVHLTCQSASGAVRNFYASTDASGVYHKAVDTASAPCVVDLDLGGSYLFSFVPVLPDGDTIAHINVMTDALLALALGGTDLYDAPSKAGLATLGTAIAKHADSNAWQAMQTKLLQSTPGLGLQADAALMQGNPVVQPLGNAAGIAGAAYYRLLQSLAHKGIGSLQLQTAVKGSAVYVVLPGSNGAEVMDTQSGLVWQRCVAGMVWSGSDCTGTAQFTAWTAVPALLVQANSTNVGTASQWRLPTVPELTGLLGQQLGESGVSPLWFPASPADWTWSATPTNDPVYVARAVDMQSGQYGDGTADAEALIRLVRQ